MVIWGNQGCKKHCRQLLNPIRMATGGWVCTMAACGSGSISVASFPLPRDMAWAWLAMAWEPLLKEPTSLLSSPLILAGEHYSHHRQG